MTNDSTKDLPPETDKDKPADAPPEVRHATGMESLEEAAGHMEHHEERRHIGPHMGGGHHHRPRRGSGPQQR
jgi:hypothetical protein